MGKQELVSVIIPVYNVEEYLRECVDSVLKQEYQNLQIILIDDGSKDNSGKICDEYGKLDERIQVYHQKNQGLSLTRNKGMDIANGKYVYFLDSDDWILPNTISELVSVAEKELADMIFFDAVSFTDESENFRVEQRYIRKNDYITDSGYTILGELQEKREYHSAVQLYFFKRDFLDTNTIRFQPGILYEDMIFTYIAFCKAEKVSQVKQALYYRRYRSNSIMTSRKNKKHYDSAKVVYEKVRDVSEQIGRLEDETSRTYVARCAFNALNMYRKLLKTERKECKASYKNLKREIQKDHAYGEQALYMRCYGTFPWFCYKVYEKSLERVLKGRK